MPFGAVVVVTGAPGTGKSSVAKRLAQASPSEQAVHLHADDFHAYIVKGFIEPWRREAHSQNTIVVDAVVECARRYARGGLEVVVDGIFGPWFLEPWLALAAEGVNVHYIVLRPDEATTLARGTARSAPGALVDPRVISQMWQQFSALGAFEAHALDTATWTLDETIVQVRGAVSEGRLLIAR